MTVFCWTYQLARSNWTFQEDRTATSQQEFWQRSGCRVIRCWFKLVAAVCCWQLNKNQPREAQWQRKHRKSDSYLRFLIIWEIKNPLDHFYLNCFRFLSKTFSPISSFFWVFCKFTPTLAWQLSQMFVAVLRCLHVRNGF